MVNRKLLKYLPPVINGAAFAQLSFTVVQTVDELDYTRPFLLSPRHERVWSSCTHGVCITYNSFEFGCVTHDFRPWCPSKSRVCPLYAKIKPLFSKIDPKKLICWTARELNCKEIHMIFLFWLSFFYWGFILPAFDKTSGMKQLCIRPMRNLLFLNNVRSVMNESFQLCLIKKSWILTLFNKIQSRCETN